MDTKRLRLVSATEFNTFKSTDCIPSILLSADSSKETVREQKSSRFQCQTRGWNWESWIWIFALLRKNTAKL